MEPEPIRFELSNTDHIAAVTQLATNPETFGILCDAAFRLRLDYDQMREIIAGSLELDEFRGRFGADAEQEAVRYCEATVRFLLWMRRQSDAVDAAIDAEEQEEN